MFQICSLFQITSLTEPFFKVGSVNDVILFQHTKFLAHLDKCSDSLVKLLTCMTGRELNADASLTFRNYGVIESRNIDAFLKQAVCIALRQRSIVEHYSTDSALSRFDVKAGSEHLVAEVVYILYEAIVNGVILLQHLEHLKACTDD